MAHNKWYKNQYKKIATYVVGTGIAIGILAGAYLLGKSTAPKPKKEEKTIEQIIEQKIQRISALEDSLRKITADIAKMKESYEKKGKNIINKGAHGQRTGDGQGTGGYWGVVGEGQ